MIRFELNRCLRGKGIKLAVLLAVLLAVGEFFGYSVIFKDMLKYMKAFQLDNGDYAVGIYPPSLYQGFINGECYTFLNTLYYYLFSLLAVLPFGTSFFQDEASGYLKYIYTKKKKEEYLLAKYVVTFLSGALFSVLPIVLSFLLNGLYVQAVVPQHMAMQGNVSDAMPFSEYYYSQPWIYFLLYLLLEMLAGGFLASLALCISFLAKNSILVTFFPMLFYIAMDYVTGELQMEEYSINRLINPMRVGPQERTAVSVFLPMVILAIAGFLVFFLVGRKRERIL